MVGRWIAFTCLLFSSCLFMLFVTPTNIHSRPQPPPMTIQAYSYDKPTPLPRTGIVIADSMLNIRAAPDDDSEILGLLRKGEVLTIYGRDATCNWLYVEERGGHEGWVSRSYVALKGGLNCAKLDDVTPRVVTPFPTKAPITGMPTLVNLPQSTPSETSQLFFGIIRTYASAIGLAVSLTFMIALLLFFIRRSRQPQATAKATFSPLALLSTQLGSPFSKLAHNGPPADQPQPGIAYLATAQVSQAQIYYPLDKPTITIGRDPSCEIRIDENYQTISRRHAQIVRQGTDYLVVDLNSVSGVYLDAIRVGRNKLHDGVTVDIGHAVAFTFRQNQKGIAP